MLVETNIFECQQVAYEFIDKDKIVRKEITSSWALRELSKVDRKAVIEFMDIYQNRLHKRVLKEVNHKLYFGTKN